MPRRQVKPMEIFKVFGSVFLKSDEADKGLDNIDKKAGGLGKALGNLGKIALGAGAFIGGALMGIAAKGIGDASQMQEKVAQLDAVLKSTGGAAGMARDEIIGMADALEKTTKFSADQTLEGQNLLLTFTNIGKDVFPQATKTLLDMATALKTDASGSAIQLGKALNDPVAGISALSRVGVTFTEEQKNVIKSLVDTGDVAGAQKVILAELSKEFGGSAEAAGKTFAGQVEIAKNSVGQLVEGVGNALMPTLLTMLGWVNQNMPTIQAVMDTAFKVSGDTISTVVSIVTTYLLPILQQLWDWIQPQLPAIQQMFTGSFGIIGDALGVFIDIITEIVKMVLPPLTKIFTYIMNTLVPKLAGSFQEWMPIILAIIQGLWDGIKPILDLIVAAFNYAWPYIQLIVSNVVDTISGVISGLLKVLQGIIDFVVGVFTGDWERAWKGIKEIFSGIFEGLGSIIKGALNQIIIYVNAAIDALNKLKFAFPDWVPGMGGKSFGLSIPRIPQLAMGGNILDDGSVLVGERGPEILTGIKGAKVTPLDKTGGITVHINNPHLYNERDADKLGDLLVRRLRVLGVTP